MEVKELLRAYRTHPAVKSLEKSLLDERLCTIHLNGVRTSSTAVLFASLAEFSPKAAQHPFLFVFDDAEEAGYFYHDMTQLLGERQVLFFPSSFRREVRFGQVDAANRILRTEALSLIASGSHPAFIISYPDALSELVVTKQHLHTSTLTLKRGERMEITTIERSISDLGFTHVDYVYEPGQFAIRGGIVDVYSFSSEYPYRMDFLDDEIDSIRTFDIQSQLSLTRCDEVSIVPELQPEEAVSESLLEFLPKESVLVFKDSRYAHEKVEQIYDMGFAEQALLEGDTDEASNRLRRESILLPGDEFGRQIQSFRTVVIGHSVPEETCYTKINIDTTAQPLFHKNFDLLKKALGDYAQKGYKIYILADSPKQNERLSNILEERGSGITFTPVERTLHAGYADNTLKICVFTDHQIFDRFHKYNLRSDEARGGKVSLSLKELQQFELGDYVVHVDHGVGRFAGLVSIPENGKLQEKIKIVFQDDDAVFVSIHALHKVSKYKGKDGEPPRINKLGTGAWEKLKERTKTKIKDIARDLIKLYSKRQREKGFQFSPDGYLQNELEASFPYEDTPDQSLAYQNVKADMEKPKPMDRLICGDVGFGKTEVAIRAALKACVDGKQVAILVPTTVLAFQHFRTFSERLKGFPVRVDYLSRAKTGKDTSDILKDLAEGRINIIVGTHKLIGKTVQFHDLGLLIIDEEQKFGVSTKEKLRQMRTNVDTLTLTATPIPRTLQFSLMGARDLSVIQTPPPNRRPIQTELHTFSPQIIAEAINFEMSRNGQVFIVNNRISGLPELESLVRKHVPDARVAVGHGQMPTNELERIILDFCNYDYDVLISTTIIENGIDIPNANTIIINSAQNFGLSDLHQMRGRVGRSNKKAFCYLLAPPLSALTPEAHRRLQAIENFSDLGSGIHIAMQDLDIRGAGNLLGAEQSGFITDLGYDTYQKILAEAVSELKNEEFAELYADEIAKGEDVSGEEFVDECLLDSDIPMSFPNHYIPGSSERMLLYRELDNLKSDAETKAFRQRLQDRFGPIPDESEELIRVVALRQLGKYFGASRIVLKSERMSLYFVQNASSPFFQSRAFGQIIAYATTNTRHCKLEEKNLRRSMVITPVTSVSQAVSLLLRVKLMRPA